MPPRQNKDSKPVAVVVGATSKWQSDGRNTKLAHGRTLSDDDVPVTARWGDVIERYGYGEPAV